MTLGTFMLYFPEHGELKFTLPIYLLQSLQEHLSVVQSFTFSLMIFIDFAYLILLCIAFYKRINSLNPNFMNNLFKVKNVTKDTNINKKINAWR